MDNPLLLQAESISSATPPQKGANEANFQVFVPIRWEFLGIAPNWFPSGFVRVQIP